MLTGQRSLQEWTQHIRLQKGLFAVCCPLPSPVFNLSVRLQVVFISIKSLFLDLLNTKRGVVCVCVGGGANNTVHKALETTGIRKRLHHLDAVEGILAIYTQEHWRQQVNKQCEVSRTEILWRHQMPQQFILHCSGGYNFWKTIRRSTKKSRWVHVKNTLVMKSNEIAELVEGWKSLKTKTFCKRLYHSSTSHSSFVLKHTLSRMSSLEWMHYVLFTIICESLNLRISTRHIRRQAHYLSGKPTPGKLLHTCLCCESNRGP